MGVFGVILGGPQKGIDLVMGESFGEAFITAGPCDLERGVVSAPTFFEGKPKELFDRR